MRLFNVLLILFTLAIFAASIAAAAGHGYNWPLTFFPDPVRLDWRSQFDADLLLCLALIGAWVSWREGRAARGLLFGVLSVGWGGMFTFPYRMWTGLVAGGNRAGLALGVHASDTGSGAREYLESRT